MLSNNDHREPQLLFSPDSVFARFGFCASLTASSLSSDDNKLNQPIAASWIALAASRSFFF
jgi:hypothetical protein